MKLIEVGDLTLRFEDKCGFCGSSDVEAVNMASDTHVRCRGCKTRTPRCDNIRDAVQLWNWWFAAAGARPYESDSGTRFERLAALREHEAGLKRQADVLLAMRPK